ncbi:MAG: glycosyltransferase family 2 protein [Thermoleophilaceae bacterium]
MASVSVIVPARDSAATLGRTLEALAAQDFAEPFEVLVVDDGSTDGTPDLVAEAPGPVRLLRQDRLGPAEARNRGAAEAGAALLAFTDADCFPEPGWLSAGARTAAEADLVQGKVLPEAGVPIGPFDRTLWVVDHFGLFETANLFVRRSLFEQLGGFVEWLDPIVGKAMAEDVWFGWRARRAGASYAFSPEALVRHAVFPRGGRDYVDEHRRRVHFPEMVALMPELRDTFLFRRWFLSRRSALLDLGLAGALVAALSRSRLPLLALLPYARTLYGHAGRAGPSARPRLAAIDATADAVSFAALVRGSVRARSIVL